MAKLLPVGLGARRRGGITLVVAGLVHLAVSGGLSWYAGARSSSTALSAPTTERVELDVELESSPAPETHALDETTAPSVRSAPRFAARSAAAPAATGGGDTASEPVANVVEARPAGSAWTFDPMMPDLRPRAGGLVPSNEVVAADERTQPSTTGGLVEGLDAADQAHGLARGGPVRSAVELAARGDGPVKGSATFSITVFDDGRVDVDVASNHTDWRQILPEIREAVRRAQVHVPPNSRGLNVVVAVEATVKYPDGYEPPDTTTVSAKTALDVRRPWLDVSVRGRRCSAAVVVAAGGLGGGANCAVGVAARIVTTRIVREQRL